MADAGLKVLMAFFTPADGVFALAGDLAGTHRKMDAKAMIAEWKGLTEADKAQIRGGIEDGSLTY